jgi:hypothetical protein
VPKIKVIPYVSNYRYVKFREFWTSGRPPFWISYFKRLKILEIRIDLGPLVSWTHRLTARTRLPIARATPHPGHSALHAMPHIQRCGHRTPRSSPPPRDLRLILSLLEPKKLTRLSSLLHPYLQLLRSAVPCSAASRTSTPAAAGWAAPRRPPRAPPDRSRPQATPRRRFFR